MRPSRYTAPQEAAASGYLYCGRVAGRGAHLRENTRESSREINCCHLHSDAVINCARPAHGRHVAKATPQQCIGKTSSETAVTANKMVTNWLAYPGSEQQGVEGGQVLQGAKQREEGRTDSKACESKLREADARQRWACQKRVASCNKMCRWLEAVAYGSLLVQRRAEQLAGCPCRWSMQPSRQPSRPSL